MGKAKAGRKRKAGERTAGGRLRPAFDHGCEGVQRRRALYAHITPANENGPEKRNVDHTFDAIGRAWSAGLLEIEGKDSAAMRDAGRDYAALFWRIYGIGKHKDSLSRFVASSGGAGSNDEALEAAFNQRNDALRGMGHTIKLAVEKLCLDDPGGSDAGPAWLDRLIFFKRQKIAAQPGDKEILENALKGLACFV